MDAGLLLQVGGMVVSAAAVYGGIRSDLRGMAERMARAEGDIKTNRDRFDHHIEMHLQERKA